MEIEQEYPLFFPRRRGLPGRGATLSEADFRPSRRAGAVFLDEIGVDLFNFGFEHSLMEMKERTGGNVTLLGNIPPRDVLAQGTPQDVADSVRSAMGRLAERSRIVLSCGGGLPAGVSTGNIGAFVREVGLWKKTRDGYC